MMNAAAAGVIGRRNNSHRPERHMSRIVSCALLSSLAIFLTASSRLAAADKTAKSHESAATAREQVAAALRAEVAGENERRAELLATATGIAPDLSDANWHLGRVRVAGKWVTLDEAQQEAANDPLITEYRKLRDEAGDDPKSLRSLAAWCQKNGHEEFARIHYAQLLSRQDIDDQTRQEAIRRLNLVQSGGAWVTKEELVARQRRHAELERALMQWRPRLKKLELAIDGENPAARDWAIKELDSLADPHVVPALESFLLEGGDRFSEAAATLLSKFPEYEATQALVHFALQSSFAGARDAAITGLKKRSQHEFVPLLMAALISSLKSQYQISLDPRGNVRYAHAVLQEAPSQNMLLVANRATAPINVTTTVRIFDPNSRSSRYDLVQSRQEVAQGQFTQALLQAAELEMLFRSANMQAEASNNKVFDCLEQTTQQKIPRQPSQWWSWWQDYNEYNWPKPTQYLCSYGQNYYPVYHFQLVTTGKTSCFIAGTLVRSESGLVPIESIQSGDRVLSQNQNTGELAYKLVLRTTLRPASKMLCIYASGDEVTTTLGHPFWVDGRGWKMAKELKEGDLLHSLHGAVRVDKIEQAGEEKAYNLVVDDFNTYFVGQQGLLVHDNEFRKPTRAIVPGLTAEDDDALFVKK
jgi:hypothetical protein